MREALVEAVLRAMYDKAKPEPAAWPFQSKQVRKEDVICQPQTRSPQEEKIKRRGPSVLLVH